jgi:hypothetical protein
VHRQWLEFPAERIQDESEAFECRGPQKRGISGFAEHDKGIASHAQVLKGGRTQSSFYEFTVAQDKLADGMWSDFQFGKNFRGNKTIGGSRIHKKLDFASARTVGRISNCRFDVRDTHFFTILMSNRNGALIISDKEIDGSTKRLFGIGIV